MEQAINQPINQSINQLENQKVTTMQEQNFEKKRVRRTKAEIEQDNLNKAMQIVLGTQTNTEMTEENMQVEEKIEVVGNRTDRYVYSSDTFDALTVAYNTNKNIILFGPGGYSKSTFSLDFMLDKGHEPFVVTMGKGMTVDRLFGGLDLKKFQEDGSIEYLVENSFMNREYVIFEEMFDAPDYILEQLKDVLSSKILRNGSQVFPLKTKFIICNTNRTRESFSKNSSSLLALLERFPLELEVVWKDHNRITYENLLNSVRGSADPLLTFVLEEFANAGKTISPRIAITAAEVLDACGPDCFRFIADFANHKEILKTALTKFKAVEQFMMFQEAIKEYIGFMEPLVFDEMTGKNIREAIEYHNNFLKALKKIKNAKTDDSLSEKKISLVKEASSRSEAYAERINLYTAANGAPKNDKGETLTPEVEIDELVKDIEL